MKHLIALKGPDGEVWLREENPFSEVPVTEYMEDALDHARFERDNPPYPLHNHTLTPGDRVEADGFELVWQWQSVYGTWGLINNDDRDWNKHDYEVNGFNTRQCYIPVTSKALDLNKLEREVDTFIAGQTAESYKETLGQIYLASKEGVKEEIHENCLILPNETISWDDKWLDISNSEDSISFDKTEAKQLRDFLNQLPL